MCNARLSTPGSPRPPTRATHYVATLQLGLLQLGLLLRGLLLLGLLLPGLLLCVPLVTPASADDMMEFVGQYTPVFFVHWLDVDLAGPTAYVCGLSGLSLFDVGDATPPDFYGRFQPPGGTQFYHTTASSPHAFCAARHNGIWVIDVTNPSSPALTSSHDEGNTSFEGLLLDGAALYTAVHEEGLRIYDVSNPSSFVLLGAVPGLTNAWAVAKASQWVYVADGDGGLRVIDCTDPGNPLLVATVPTSGAAQDVVLRGDRAYVACAAGGMDIFDVQTPDAPVMLGNFDSEYSAFLLAADPLADRVYIASWDIVEVVDVSNPAAPARIGFEDTPRRAMGVAADDDHVYVADWSSFRVYDYGPTAQPDVHVEPGTVSFPVIPLGESADTTITVSNTGGSSLVVSNIQTNSGDFAAFPTSFSVPPGGAQGVTLTATASAAQAVGNLRVVSNDPDESNSRILIDYGTVGSPPIDFTLTDLGGAQHSLTDYLGDVVLLAFFASW